MEKYEIIEEIGSTLLDKVINFNKLSDEDVQDLCREDLRYPLSSEIVDHIIEKLHTIKNNHEKIIICGDYDCDGVCATSIMVNAFKIFGLDYGFYIPNRFSDGYGLNPNTVELAHQKGYQHLITVDNGVKALEALQKARDYNIDIILTDHHNYDKDELIYDDFLHPDLLDDYYGKICGAGIALQISEALIGENDLATILGGIATIGDVVELKKYNRFLVKKTINLLNTKYFSWLNKLCPTVKKWDSEKIAFNIVPRINAVGRMNSKFSPNDLVRFITSDDEEYQSKCADAINYLNDERKKLSMNMYQQAQGLIDNQNFIVACDERFHEGLNGIVAGKLCEKYNCPAMVLSANDDLYKGSIRSNGIDLSHFFDDLLDELTAYGGHRLASGIAFKKEQLPLVKKYCIEHADESEIIKKPVLLITQEEATLDNLKTLDCLEPYGHGIEKPLMALKVHIDKAFKIAKGKHLKMQAGELDIMKFNDYDIDARSLINQDVMIIGKLQLNEYGNKESVSFFVDDIIY